MSGPQGFPEVTITGTEEDVMDFLIEYTHGDVDQALDLFETAVQAPLGEHSMLEEVSVTVDWVPTSHR